MKPQLKIIKDESGINELINYLADKEFIAFDTETTGVHFGCEVIGYSVCADEAVAYYVILSHWDNEKQQLISYSDLKTASIKLMQSLVGKSLICHNAIFDCRVIQDAFKVSLIGSVHTDTMVLAHLLNENRRVGLKELAAEYFGADSTKQQADMKASVIANGGKLTKDNYEMYKASADLMALYGAQDTILTFKLFYQLVPELIDQGLDKFFYEEETMPLLRGPTYQLNTVGLKVDQAYLMDLKKTLEAECLIAKDFIYSEIAVHIKDKYPGTSKKNTFNIGSSQQLSWLLFGKMELEFGTLTKAGKDACIKMGINPPYAKGAKKAFIHQCLQTAGSILTPEATVNGKKVRSKKIKDPWAYIACDKKTLTKLAPKFKWIQKLLEYQRKTKILNTYVEGINERVQYGIIRPSFLQHGTTSGRFSSRNPNFQNLPRDDKRVKHAITARHGKLFVGADYSQLEPRVFAYFSQDSRLIKAFDGTSDFYSAIGMEVYGKSDCTPQKDGSPEAFGVKYKHLRDLSKVIALASTYGSTAHQLSSTTGKSVEDTQLDIDNYFEAFPGVAHMMLESHAMVKRDGFVKTLFGRPRRIPEAMKIDKLYGKKSHGEYPYEVRNILNLAVNHRIQGTGASIVNRAMIKFYNDAKAADINCSLVVQVHDSLVIECNEADAEDVALLLENAMITATKLEGIELEAIPKIGRTLADV